jgi:2-oxoglutarate dehydrogenase complex dehydrogenase (E1) component-like enzyme
MAIIRLEQLYPLAKEHLATVLNRYPNEAQIFWVQEEPRNMGAWPFLHQLWYDGETCLRQELGGREIGFVGRTRTATPAVGSHKVHATEQRAIVEKAFQL